MAELGKCCCICKREVVFVEWKLWLSKESLLKASLLKASSSKGSCVFRDSQMSALVSQRELFQRRKSWFVGRREAFGDSQGVSSDFEG